MKYRNVAHPGGVASLTLSAGVAGKVTLTGLFDPAGPAGTPVSVRLHPTDAPICWRASYTRTS